MYNENRYILFKNNVDIESFYKNFNKNLFKHLDVKKIIELKQFSKKLHGHFIGNNGYAKQSKYIRIMNKIKTNPKAYNVTNDLEKYILFMYSIDPDYSATYMYATVNKIEDIKIELVKKFGIYDPTLILIEKYYIQNILGPKQRKKIEDKIEELSYR